MDQHPALHVLAATQYAMVSAGQARERSVSRRSMNRLVASGAWGWATPRVLRLVGAPDDHRSHLMMAVLDGGPGTVVARRAAAALWSLPGFPYGPVEVCRQKSRRSRPAGVGRLYTVRYLPDHLTTEVAGVPVVSLPYLMFQLAGFLPPARLDKVVLAVVRKSPAMLNRLHDLLPELAERGRNGIVAMRGFLERHPRGSRVPESNLEARFEHLLAEAGEPALERQVDVGGHEWIGRVDFLDRRLGLVFEVDGDAYHSMTDDRAHDGRRDQALRDAGIRGIVRIPEAWIWHEPWRAVAAVRAARRQPWPAPVGSGS